MKPFLALFGCDLLILVMQLVAHHKLIGPADIVGFTLTTIGGAFLAAVMIARRNTMAGPAQRRTEKRNH